MLNYFLKPYYEERFIYYFQSIQQWLHEIFISKALEKEHPNARCTIFV